MTEARRRQAIVKMATDSSFAERVRTNPESVASEYGLDADDMAVLESLRDDVGSDGATTLDPRLSKSALFFGGGQHAATGHGDAHYSGDEHPAAIDCNGMITSGKDHHLAGMLCTENPAAVQCSEAPAAIECNGMITGGKGHLAGMLCDESPVGLKSDQHLAGMLCSETPAAIQCNGMIGGDATADVGLDTSYKDVAFGDFDGGEAEA